MPNEKFSRSFYAPQNSSIPTLHHPSHRLASRLILGQFWVYAYFMPVSIPQKNRRFSKKICTFAQKYPNMGNKENNTQLSDSKERKSALTVKDWALEDRPREKLIAKGKKELSNAELIAILIGSGSVGQSAVDVRFWMTHNNLSIRHLRKVLSSFCAENFSYPTDNQIDTGQQKTPTGFQGLCLPWCLRGGSTCRRRFRPVWSSGR